MPLTDLALLNLHSLRTNLKRLMDPKVLQKLAELLEATGTEKGSLLERYYYFAKTSEHGPDCRYAQLAKKFFEEDEAEKCAEAIKWLYKNWVEKE